MRTLDGRYTGWIPRAVWVPRMGRRVRAALEWRAGLSRPSVFGMVRTYSGEFVATVGRPLVPFGWSLRRERNRDLYLLAPRWYFLPRDIADLCWRAYVEITRLAIQRGAAEVEHEYSVRWWPSCPRFE